MLPWRRSYAPRSKKWTLHILFLALNALWSCRVTIHGNFTGRYVCRVCGEESNGDKGWVRPSNGGLMLRCPKFPECHGTCEFDPALIDREYASQPVVLRDYQENAIELIHQSFSEGNQYVACCLATGAGKTTVANTYISKYRNKDCVLWIAPAKELLFQASANLHSHADAPQFVGDDLLVYNRTGGPDTGTIRYCTLHRLYGILKNKQIHVQPSLIVWDEFHWAERTLMGTQVKIWTQRVKNWAQRHSISILGLSATPHFGTDFTIACAADHFTLAKQGWLAYPLIRAYDSNALLPIDSTISKATACDFPAARQCADNSEIAQFYVDNIEWCGKTLVKTKTIAQANDLEATLTNLGVNARCVHSSLTVFEQRDTLKKFKVATGKCVLIIVQIGSQGLDIPDIETIFLTHKIQEFHTYAQIVGRGARKQKGKTHFKIVEFHPDLYRMRQAFFIPLQFLNSKAVKRHRDVEVLQIQEAKPNCVNS